MTGNVSFYGKTPTEDHMELRHENIVVKVGPGCRQQALDFVKACNAETEITRRILILAVTILIIAWGTWMIFAPEERAIASQVAGPILLVLALGAFGARRFLVKTPKLLIQASTSTNGDE